MNLALWMDNLGSYSIQIAFLVIVGGLLPFLVRLHLPRVMLLYWQILLLVCLLLPLVQPWNKVFDATFIGSESLPSPPDLGESASVTAPQQFDGSAGTPAYREAIVVILVLGILGRFLWIALGLFRIGRYRVRARLFSPLPPAVEAMQRRVGVFPPLRVSADLAGPITFGALRPVVIFPTEFLDMKPSIQEAIACHELLHVRRQDWFFTAVEEVIRSFFWFHPAIWWLISRIRLTREQVVDREVVQLTQHPGRYIESLLEVANRKKPVSAASPLFLREGQLTQRIALMVKETSMSKPRLIGSLVLILGFVLVAGHWVIEAFPLIAPQETSSLPASRERTKSVTFEEFVSYDRKERSRIFDKLSAENKSELSKTSARRYLERNRSRLSEEQIQWIEGVLELIDMDLYQSLAEEVEAIKHSADPTQEFFSRQKRRKEKDSHLRKGLRLFPAWELAPLSIVNWR